jgi:hypothetical protein
VEEDTARALAQRRHAQALRRHPRSLA